MTFWLSNRLLKQLASKAAGEKQPEAYPLEYVEDCFDPRTKLDARLSILPTCSRLFAATPFLVLRPALGLIAQPQWCGEVL